MIFKTKYDIGQQVECCETGLLYRIDEIVIHVDIFETKFLYKVDGFLYSTLELERHFIIHERG